MKNRKRLYGILLVCVPVLFPVIITVYAIMEFILSQSASAGSTTLPVIASLVRVVLGLLAMLVLFGSFATVPLGIYLIATSGEKGKAQEKEKEEQK